MTVQVAADDLLEREAELASIADALAAAERGDGQLVVVEGEAGIGKSALLASAIDLASAAGMTTLRSAGNELEQLHPFGVVQSLLAPLVRQPGGDELLRGPAELTRAVLDPRARADAERATDPVAMLHAILWLVVDAAERRPMALFVDDAHWADEASLRFLALLAHRISSLPVALLVGMRPAVSAAPGIMEQVRSHGLATRLSLSRLSERGVDTLIRRSGGIHLDEPARRAMWSQTHGNPFYVVELLRTVPADAGRSGESVPDTISASIRRRLTASGEGAQPLAEAIAILGEEADLSSAARLAALPMDDAIQLVRRLTERALLEPDRLAFRHPIVLAAVLDGIPSTLRSPLHRSAAAMLAAAGSTVAAAGHLLESDPARDPEAVTTLRDAARIALAQGDPHAAATFLVRALSEPPEPQFLGQLLLELATAEAAQGMATAPDRFDEAIERIEQPHARAQARLAQGHALIQSGRWSEGAVAFEAGLGEVDARDVELKSRLEAGFVSSAYVGLGDHVEASRRLERILAAPLHDPAHRELAAWSAFQKTLAVTATATEAASLARRALAGASLDPLIRASQVIELVAGVLIATGDVVEELALLDDALDTARRLNAYQKIGIYSYCRTLPNLVSGRIQDAIADAETALAAHEHGWEIFYPGTLAALAWARLELGDVDAAEQALVMDDDRWAQRLDYQFMVPIARGRVRADRGEFAGAIQQFHLARDAGAVIGVRTATILGDWRPWCAVALRRSGERSEAVALAEEAIEIAQRWGAAFGEGRAHWALGVALGDAAGIEHLRTAVDLLANGPLRLEHTRAAVELGSALRRAGKTVEARDELRKSADLAHGIGALALGARAREELAAAGARPRRYAISGISALTPSELRVARLASEGRTNREVAQSLFVTPKAIEYHLANAYRKLGIEGRAGLTGALAEPATTGGASA